MSLSIAIPAMVNDTALPGPPSASPEGPRPDAPHSRNHTPPAAEAAVSARTRAGGCSLRTCCARGPVAQGRM